MLNAAHSSMPHARRAAALLTAALLMSALLFLGACRSAAPPAAAPPPMAFPGETWAEDTPASQGVEAEALEAALRVLEDFSGEDGVSQTVIVRNGVMIFQGDSAAKQHGVYSVTKSITSTALGLLIEDGRAALDQKAAGVEPLLREEYGDVTLQHFTTMTSGYSATGPNRWGEASADWSETPFAVGEPLFAPGGAYAYWDEAMIMLGRVLARLAGEDLHALIDRRVMQPIGVGEWSWWAMEDRLGGRPVRYGATGVELSALQLARVGHLFLNEGRWDGRQLVPADWVRAATQPQVPADLPLADTDRRDVDGRGAYGFNWWTNGVGPSGKRAMPDAPPGLYYASGFNNNMLFVIPEWQMVVARMGEDGNPPEGKPAAYNRFFERLGDAVRGD